jgi:hypothetical protein
MWFISMKTGVRSPDMEEDDILYEEPEPRSAPGDSLRRGHSGHEKRGPA